MYVLESRKGTIESVIKENPKAKAVGIVKNIKNGILRITYTHYGKPFDWETRFCVSRFMAYGNDNRQAQLNL